MSDLSRVVPVPLAASSLTGWAPPAAHFGLICRTRLFTELIFDTRSPAAVFAIDAVTTDFEAL
jgi:hypothetical protein